MTDPEFIHPDDLRKIQRRRALEQVNVRQVSEAEWKIVEAHRAAAPPPPPGARELAIHVLKILRSQFSREGLMDEDGLVMRRIDEHLDALGHRDAAQEEAGPASSGPG